MNMDWDQCDNCGKLGPAAELNEDGLCATCAADDSAPRRFEDELYPISEQDNKKAVRDWHTRAIVRVLETTPAGSVDPSGTRIFRAGEECEMLQWGHAGSLVSRRVWWDSYDSDGAHIISADKVEVVRILDEVSPQEE